MNKYKAKCTIYVFYTNIVFKVNKYTVKFISCLYVIAWL